MKIDEIIERLKSGSTIIKKSEIRFKNNKIVRGSFWSYYIDDVKIRETQFDSIRYRLKKVGGDLSSSIYKFEI